MPGMAQPIPDDQLAIVPAERSIVGRTCRRSSAPRTIRPCASASASRSRGSQLGFGSTLAERAETPAVSRPRCGNAGAPSTSGLGRLSWTTSRSDGVAIEPRTSYPQPAPRPRPLDRTAARTRTDDGVWAATCFVARKGFRLRGITYALARAHDRLRARPRGPRARGLPDDHAARGGNHLGRTPRRQHATSSPTQGSSR